MAGRPALALILWPAAAAALTLAPIAPYTNQCLQRLGSTTQDDADAGEEDEEDEEAAAALDEELETPGTEDEDEALENPLGCTLALLTLARVERDAGEEGAQATFARALECCRHTGAAGLIREVEGELE